VRTLSLGDRGKEVIDVQQRLYALGFDLGGEGLDGFLGRRTQAALRAFQQRRGLIVDGSVGANTWRELVEAGYELGERLLYLRVPPFRGDDVLGLEVKLNLLGFNAGPERGIFDQAVDHAVKEFQRNAGLQPDGVVGEATLAMLDAVRKAESGREGKKIPERDEGYVAARALTGQTVVIDPGHGGADHGVIGGHGLREKDYTLALSLRLAQLLRAEGCRVRLTRERDERVGTWPRTNRRMRTARPATTSSATTTSPSTACAWPAVSDAVLPSSVCGQCRRWAATTPCCASREPSP
jgi:N-acetylmuramoyl-L-alanine amidase